MPTKPAFKSGKQFRRTRALHCALLQVQCSLLRALQEQPSHLRKNCKASLAKFCYYCQNDIHSGCHCHCPPSKIKNLPTCAKVSLTPQWKRSQKHHEVHQKFRHLFYVEGTHVLPWRAAVQAILLHTIPGLLHPVCGNSCTPLP